MKKVILSSFHSCSLDALECEGVEPDRILSFDSHIDTNLLGILEEVLSKIHDNRPLRYAFTDGGAHALMTKAFPHTDIDIVIPRVCLEGNIAVMQNRFLDIFNFSTETEAFREFIEFSKKAFNLNIKLSPPKDPVAFSSLLSSDSIIDIDVDYFGDLQNECYIPRIGPGAKLHDFGNLERALRLIRSTKPNIITFSESKVSCLNDPSSKTNYLLNRLKSMGYTIETFFLYGSDKQAWEYLHKLREFDLLVRRNEGTLDISNDNTFDRQNQAISDSVKEFFSAMH
ncbi:MAG: hypothetical protein WA323_02410 [Candidatus Nitrosopolaris sp.]